MHNGDDSDNRAAARNIAAVTHIGAEVRIGVAAQFEEDPRPDFGANCDCS